MELGQPYTEGTYCRKEGSPKRIYGMNGEKLIIKIGEETTREKKRCAAHSLQGEKMKNSLLSTVQPGVDRAVTVGWPSPNILTMAEMGSACRESSISTQSTTNNQPYNPSLYLYNRASIVQENSGNGRSQLAMQVLRIRRGASAIEIENYLPIVLKRLTMALVGGLWTWKMDGILLDDDNGWYAQPVFY